MLSPTNISSPYRCGKKSESGKFILDKYAVDCLEIDLIVVDFMPLAFHQPPLHVFTEQLPLEAHCNWLVSELISPHLKT